MRSQLQLFRRHVWAWSVPLALILLNVAWTMLFGSGARLRAADLESRLARTREEHAATASRFTEREQLWIAMVQNRDRIEGLYTERFSTERARLTAIVAELRELARRTGLEPRSVSYPEQPLEQYGLLQRSFVFSVEGRYADLRTFLHLLELSPSFLTVEQIRVSDGGRGALRIALRLSTLFAIEPEPTSPPTVEEAGSS